MLHPVSYGAMSQVSGSQVCIVHQDDDLVKVFSGERKRFVIKENIDLKGKEVIVGKGSVLVFKGGSLCNGMIVGNYTKVEAANYEIFKRGITRYRAYIEAGTSPNLPPSLITEHRNSIVIDGTWVNNKCESNWTGLQNNVQEDVMLAVKNFVVLHKEGAVVTFPTIDAVGYERASFPGNRIIDFSNSTISYPDDLNIWEDNTICIPDSADSCPLESGWGFISIKGNTTLKNLNLDGKSNYRQDEPIRKGVSCLLYIGITNKVVIENVSLSNALGPAICSHSRTKNVLFRNCKFYNIGEHVVYSHQCLGYCHFVGCSFDTWDSERLSEYRNDFNYLFKHVPLYEEGQISYEELYGFDLSFTKCMFNNPRRENSQGRTLGGFFTGTFPLVINLTDCKFSGAYPVFNPGNGSRITESVGKAYRLVAQKCDGAPYVFSGKSNCNIVTEFYDCINLPFRTVYAKRYERCRLILDIYESNVENVTPCFESEFSEPLIVKDCIFIDMGEATKINHPVFHRPVVFDNCLFSSDVCRPIVNDLITVKGDSISSITFRSCEMDIPSFRLVGGNKEVEAMLINKCVFIALEPQYLGISSKVKIDIDNIVADELKAKR